MSFVTAVNQTFLKNPQINDTSIWFKNRRRTTLSAQVSPGATAINLTDASNFPSTGGKLRISPGETEEEYEVIYTGKTGNQLTGVSGVTNTHPSGRPVQFRNITLNFSGGWLTAYRDDAELNSKNDYKISFPYDGDGNSPNIGVILRYTSAGFIRAYHYAGPYTGSPYYHLYVQKYESGTDTWTTLVSDGYTYSNAIDQGICEAWVKGNFGAFKVEGTYIGGSSGAESVAFVIPAGFETGRPGISCASSGGDLLVGEFEVGEL